MASYEDMKSEEDEESTCTTIMKQLKTHRMLALSSVAVIVTGVLVLKFAEGWQFVTTIYVITQIVTTIGYGDAVPKQDAVKLFLSFYVLFCLVIVANLINVIVEAVIDRNAKALRNRIRSMERGLDGNSSMHDDALKKKYGKRNQLIAAFLLFLFAIAFGTIFYATTESCSCSYGYTEVENCTKHFYNGTDYLNEHDSCVATGGSKTGWIDAWYMSVITATTIGFGDFTPKSILGRYVGICWMLFSIAAAANFIVSLSAFIDGSDEPKWESASDIDLEVFEKADVNHDGKMSLSEYRNYMLLSHGIVPKETMDAIDSSFRKMDVHRSGSVTFRAVRDIALAAAADGSESEGGESS